MTSAADLTLCCAGQVASVVEEGLPTAEHSWFDGYAWQLSYCERCAFDSCTFAAHAATFSASGSSQTMPCYSVLASYESAWVDSAGVCSMWAGGFQRCTMICSRGSFGASGGWPLLIARLTQTQTNATDGAAANGLAVLNLQMSTVVTTQRKSPSSVVRFT